MRSSVILVAMTITLLGAGPATRPAEKQLPKNASTGEKYLAAVSATKIAEEAARRAMDAATQSAKETAAYKDAQGDVEKSEAALNLARASGSPRDRLDASAEFNRARKHLADIESDYTRKDAGLNTALGLLADARATEAKAKESLAEDLRAIGKAKDERNRQEEAERMKDPKYAAAKQGRVIAGMTEEQLREALRIGKYTMSANTNEYLVDGKAVRISTYVPGGATIDTPYKKIIVADGLVTEVKTFSSNDFVPTETKF